MYPSKVKMKFKEHKYYNDLDSPIFEAGKVYEIEGSEWIQRWLKRGGEIVDEVKVVAPVIPVEPEEIDQDLEDLADSEEKLEDDSKEESKSSKSKKGSKPSSKK